YSHSLRRTHERVRGVLPYERVRERAERRPGRLRLAHLAVGAGALFAVVLAIVTGVELMAGRPVSDLVRGDAGAGTSLFGTHGRTATRSTPPAPTVTRTVTPSVVVTPTVTRTAPAATVTT